jgi:Holliday junction resolvasome RuvABC endonuclease subunit
MQLGLDISTTTTGYAIDNKNQIITMGFVDLKKHTDLSDKAWALLDNLTSLEHIDNVKNIIVEDSLSGFSRGFTSQQTIIKLAKFNAIVCFLCEHQLKLKPHLINATTARKQLFGKARVKGKTAKDYVSEQIQSKFDITEWIVRTRTGTVDKRNVDAMDALVVAKYSLPLI